MVPPVDQTTFGPLLRQLRQLAGLSQEELAERARMSVDTVSALERGRRRAPYRETVRLLADALAVSADDRAALEAAARRAAGMARTVRYESAAREPPLGAQPTVGRTNLVRRESTLIGRTADLERLRAVAADHSLVTVLGPGGVGKTRLATELAREDLTRRDVWFVDLAGVTDPQLVAATIAFACEALAANGELDVSHETVVTERIVGALADRPTVLLLDNCEHVIEAVRRLVPTMLDRCADLQILATSREPLNLPREALYLVPGLAIPPSDAPSATSITDSAAAQLFIERAKAQCARLAFDDVEIAAVGRICRRLEGLPLAIELAAAQTSVLSLRDLAATLDTSLTVLRVPHPAYAPRQQTLHALIEWSYDLLGATERRVFRHLSVFASGWTLEAAEAVCSDETLSRDDVLEALLSLVRRSLVVANLQAHPARYRFLDVTRLYARSKLEADERERLLHKHLNWVEEYSRSVLTMTWSDNDAFASLYGDLDDIRLALATGLADGSETVVAARITANLVNLWFEGGLQTEGGMWLTRILSRLDEERYPIEAGRLWYATAVLSTGRRVVDAAEHAVRLFSRESTMPELSFANVQLAFGLWQVGRLEDALATITRARSMQTHRVDQATRDFANTLDVHGQILNACGQSDEARRLYREAGRLYDLADDEHGAARTRGNLAELEFAVGNTVDALALVDQAAATFVRLHSISRLANARVNAATYRLALGQTDAAARDAREAFELARSAQNAPLATISAQVLAAVLALRGETADAALIAGYVEGWYRANGYQRELSEQRVDEILRATLSAAESPESLASMLESGALLTEQHVARLLQSLL